MKQHVFILGAGRSGTKILRDCLGSAKDVAAIPYDVGYVWTYGNQNLGHDELVVESASEDIKRFVRKTIASMAKRVANGQEYAFILEKSVPNTLRPAFMRSIFPNALFIHLVRDGHDVVESAMRNWQDPSDKGYFLAKLRYFPIRNVPYAFRYLANRLKNIGGSKGTRTWGPRYAGMQDDADDLGLIEVCSKQWNICVSTCRSQLSAFPESQVLEIRYEDFVTNRDVVNTICDFMGISDIKSVMEFYDIQIDPERVANFRTSLNNAQLQKIDEIADESLTAYGYK